jgi:outer membrane protein TolC
MKQFQSHIAVLAALLVAVPASGQRNSFQDDTHRIDLGEQHWYSRFTRNYEPRIVAPINLNNSNRLESLVRAGSIYLSLADAVALALENNVDIEVQRYGFLLNETALQRAQAGGNGVPSFDPVFTGNLNWNHNTQAQSNTVTSGGLVANVNEIRILNFGVQQAFVTGGTVSLNLNNNQITTNNPNNNYNPSTNANLNMQITQPLLQGFGLALNNRNIRIARNNLRVSDFQFEQQVINIVNTVSQTYWNLVSATLDVEAKRLSQAQAQKLYEDNQKQVEIGTLAPISIVQAEAQVASTTTDLLTSEGNVLIQETNLKNMLSRVGLASPLLSDARIIPTDRVRLPDVEPVEPIQDLVARAVERRPDLAQTRMQIENSKITMTGTRNAMLPQLNVVSTLQNNALSGALNEAPNVNPITGVTTPRLVNPFFIGGYGNILGQIFRRNFPNYSIGFQLNIPLRNRAAQADYTTAQLQLRQAELNYQRTLNQIRADIRNALTNVQQTRARYQAATKARALQEQTLDAEEKKNALGASTVYNVILVQRDLANARQAEVTALTAYAQAKLQLDVASGMLLERNNIEIDEAKSGRVSRAPSPIPDVLPNGAAAAPAGLRP